MKTKEKKIKHLRVDYVNSKCSHYEYYNQFVTPANMSRVKSQIGLERILTSKDEHFNDIPLKAWDNILLFDTDRQMREVGDYLTLSGVVCVAKACARQLVLDSKA